MTVDNLTQEQLSNSLIDSRWLAGFFDGEGCVSIFYNPAHSGSIQMYASICQKNNSVLQEILLSYPSGALSVDKRSGVWRIVYNGIKSRDLLLAIQPYVKCKKKQVDAAVEFINTIDNTTTVSMKKWNRRVELWQILKDEKVKAYE